MAHNSNQLSPLCFTAKFRLNVWAGLGWLALGLSVICSLNISCSRGVGSFWWERARNRK